MATEPNTKKMTKIANKGSSSQKMETQLSKKRDEDSDHDSNDDNLSEEDSDDENVDVDESKTGDMNVHEYRKFLQKIFPSKYLDDKIKKDESTYIAKGDKHRLINNENIDLEIIEVQTGVKVSEKDIIRYDDIYGRN